MKDLLLTLMIAVSLTWGCAPSDQAPTVAEATPTAAADEEITEMNFESGEVDQSTTEIDEQPAEEPTPEAP